jgi:hypothetical protein
MKAHPADRIWGATPVGILTGEFKTQRNKEYKNEG